jgi:hypothetical protein
MRLEATAGMGASEPRGLRRLYPNKVLQGQKAMAKLEDLNRRGGRALADGQHGMELQC